MFDGQRKYNSGKLTTTKARQMIQQVFIDKAAVWFNSAETPVAFTNKIKSLFVVDNLQDFLSEINSTTLDNDAYKFVNVY